MGETAPCMLTASLQAASHLRLPATPHAPPPGPRGSQSQLSTGPPGCAGPSLGLSPVGLRPGPAAWSRTQQPCPQGLGKGPLAD